MRCKACDVQLSDAESVRKDAQTGEYYDLCGACYEYSEAAVTELNDTPLVQNDISAMDI